MLMCVYFGFLHLTHCVTDNMAFSGMHVFKTLSGTAVSLNSIWVS